MSATRDRSRQKRLEKKTRNKRERARAESRRHATAPARTLASLVSRAAALPFGPAWVSAAVDDDSAPPALVTVVATRQLSRGVLLAQIVLVDRTCLGVKNGFVMPPQSELELECALDDLVSFSDDPDDDFIHYVNDRPRPIEPWHATARKLAPRVLLERYATWEPPAFGAGGRGARLLDAIERHAVGLSLPEGCERSEDVVPVALRHRLRVQAVFEVLAGLGQRSDYNALTLADPEQAYRADDLRAGLDRESASMAALGWTLQDLFRIVQIPERDRQFLLASLGTPAHAGTQTRS